MHVPITEAMCYVLNDFQNYADILGQFTRVYLYGYSQ